MSTESGANRYDVPSKVHQNVGHACERTSKIELPTNIKTGRQKLKVASDAQGAIVCLSKTDEIYKVGIADKAGMSVFEIAPRTAGEISITVSGPSLNSISKTISVE